MSQVNETDQVVIKKKIICTIGKVEQGNVFAH